jgi:hypothetical protein
MKNENVVKLEIKTCIWKAEWFTYEDGTSKIVLHESECGLLIDPFNTNITEFCFCPKCGKRIQYL